MVFLKTKFKKIREVAGHLRLAAGQTNHTTTLASSRRTWQGRRYRRRPRHRREHRDQRSPLPCVADVWALLTAGPRVTVAENGSGCTDLGYP
jgi:hypothetical protein